MKLRLKSPAAGTAAVYHWPLPNKSGYDGVKEILDTIKWGCKDIPDLEIALKRNIIKDVDVTSYESMKSLCQRYNKAIDTVLSLDKGTQKFCDRLNQPASRDLLRHILQQTYNAAVTNAEELNKYQAFSPDVYGETSFDLICQMIDQIQPTKDDVFIDLGSGVGQVILQIAATCKCKISIGIERADVPAKFAEAMQKQFKFWMQWYGKKYEKFKLIKGDFFDDCHRQKIHDASIIFVNNFAFGPSVDHMLKLRFAEMKQGTKIVSSKSFCPLNFRISDRNLSDIGTIMNVSEISPEQSSVSWTGKPVSFYLHIIDRTKLEKYFQMKKNGQLEEREVDVKSKYIEVCDLGFERRKQRKGRPRKMVNGVIRKTPPRTIKEEFGIKQEPLSFKNASSVRYSSSEAVQKELQTMLDIFKFQYLKMVDQMADPHFRDILRRDIRGEIKKHAYLKRQIRELNDEIDNIIFLMHKKVS